MTEIKRRVQYYLVKSGLGDGMYARIRNNQPYSERRVVDMMCEGNEKLVPEVVKEVLRGLIKTSSRILQDGIPITISNFIRIYPTIKGSFDGMDDGFDSSRHTLKFNVALAETFVKEVLDGLVIEKIGRPKENAILGKVVNNRTGGNELTKHFTNKLIGQYFIVSGYNLLGVEISNAMNITEAVLIGPENLDISTHTMREFGFSIVYDYELPTWLVDGTPIYINLLYKKIEEEGQVKEEKPIHGHHIETVWRDL